LHSNFHSIFCSTEAGKMLHSTRLDIYRELGTFFANKAFGDSVALTFASEATGRSPYPMPSKGSCGPALKVLCIRR